MNRKVYAKASHGLGHKNSGGIFAKNHFASMLALPQHVQSEIDRYMLHRVAGNIFVCESSKDFWKLQGNKIVKLVGNEVDNGESIPAAPSDKPAAFMANILSDLDF